MSFDRIASTTFSSNYGSRRDEEIVVGVEHRDNHAFVMDGPSYLETKIRFDQIAIDRQGFALYMDGKQVGHIEGSPESWGSVGDWILDWEGTEDFRPDRSAVDASLDKRGPDGISDSGGARSRSDRGPSEHHDTAPHARER